MFVLIANGCAHKVVQTLDEYENRIEELKKEGGLIRKSFKFDSYNDIITKYDFDSLNNYQNYALQNPNDTSIKEFELPFGLRVLDIDDKFYPDSIVAKVLLYDMEGNTINGMAPPNFIGDGDYKDYWFNVVDSSKCDDNHIKNYKVEEITSLNSEPFSLIFTLDHSGSMGKKRSQLLYDALKRTLFAIKPGDEVGIVRFNEKPTNVVELSSDRKEFILNYKFDYLDGGTKTEKAIFHSYEELNKAKAGHKKVLILFSDGGDQFTKEEMNKIEGTALREDISVFTILYGYQNDQMEEISELTGGKYYPIFTSKLFPFVFRDIYLSLSSYYKVTYYPPECEDLHKVDISFRFPNLDNSNISDHGFYDKSIFTKKDTIGSIAFVNIEFESGKSDIKDRSIPLIQKIADAMQKNQDLGIMVKGHTDDVGSEEDNMKLSQDRAEAVAQKLYEMGINSKRIKTKGFGESEPLVPNTSEENRRKNRRTEFVIIKI
jgi:outer membrane protein OmpA-like peptidoglycan-associated protein